MATLRGDKKKEEPKEEKEEEGEETEEQTVDLDIKTPGSYSVVTN